MIHTVEIILGLMVVIACLALLAHKLNIAYPILFVFGGLVLGLIPGLPRVRLDPELFFRFSFRHCFIRRRCLHRGEISARTCGPYPFGFGRVAADTNIAITRRTNQH